MTYNNLAGGRSKKSLKKRGARKSRRKGSKKLRKSKRAGQFYMTPEAKIRKLGREIINSFKDGYSGNANSKFIHFDMEKKLIDINNHLSALWCGEHNAMQYYMNIDRIGNTTYMHRFVTSNYNEGQDNVRNIMVEVNQLLDKRMPDILRISETGEPRTEVLTHILNFNRNNIKNVVADDKFCTKYKNAKNEFSGLPESKQRLAMGKRPDYFDSDNFSESRTPSTDSTSSTASTIVRGGSRRRKSKKSKRTKKSRRSRRRH